MRRPSDARANNLANRLLVGLFLLALVLPGADMLLGGALDPAPPLQEKRALANAPTWNWSVALGRDFTHSFEDWLDDHFGFRDSLVRLNSALHLFALDVSVSPSVAVGRHGWLFLNELAQRYQRATEPLSEEQLQRWRVMLEARRDWVAERGGRFLFVIAPNKHSIYPQYLPDDLVLRADRSRADQLLEWMGRHSDVPLLDLRPTLLRGASEAQVYYATDSHWNLAGARLAYEAILERLSQWFTGMSPLPDTAFSPNPLVGPGGDLARMLGVEPLFTERDRTGRLIARRARRTEELPVPGIPAAEVDPEHTYLTRIDDPGLPSAVIIRDSFMKALGPLLSQDFRLAMFVDIRTSLPFPWALIDERRPDLVLTVMVERKLQNPARFPPRDALAARREHRAQTARLLLEPDLGVKGPIVEASRCRQDGNTLVLTANERPPVLVLPPLKVDAGRRVVVTLKQTPPAISRPSLLAGPSTSGAAPARSLPIGPRGGQRHLELPPAPVTQPLRVTLGDVPGQYAVSALEAGQETVLLDALAGELRLTGASVTRTADGLMLRAEQNDPQLMLPARAALPGESLVLVVDLDLSQASTVQVYWRLPGSAGYDSQHMRHRALPAGPHLLRFHLPDAASSGWLRFDPGTGDATIRRLELASHASLWRLDPEGRLPLCVRGTVEGWSADGLALQAWDDDPQLILPPVAIDTDEQLLVRVELTAPAATVLKALLWNRRDQVYDAAHGRALPIPTGRGVAVLELPLADLSGPLRIDPGNLPGRYLIHSLAVLAARP